MNTKQHISMHRERFIDALLPGGHPNFGRLGSWHLGRLLSRVYAEVCQAGWVTVPVTKHQAMRDCVVVDARKA